MNFCFVLSVCCRSWVRDPLSLCIFPILPFFQIVLCGNACSFQPGESMRRLSFDPATWEMQKASLLVATPRGGLHRICRWTRLEWISSQISSTWNRKVNLTKKNVDPSGTDLSDQTTSYQDPTPHRVGGSVQRHVVCRPVISFPGLLSSPGTNRENFKTFIEARNNLFRVVREAKRKSWHNMLVKIPDCKSLKDFWNQIQNSKEEFNAWDDTKCLQFLNLIKDAMTMPRILPFSSSNPLQHFFSAMVQEGSWQK